MKNKPSFYKYDTKLIGELEEVRQQVERHARDYGLDFFDVIFEVLDWQQLNEIASYGGFPNRYPHWRFGMEYEQFSKSYEYGLSKIYEMVINNDPCYAYLLHSNAMVDQKTVMAHVYAHCDFFKNNVYFVHTNRKMMDEMANHRTRVLRYIERYGYERVENFIDACLSLETLIDCHSPAIRRRSSKADEEERLIRKLRVERSYMDKFINPEEFLSLQREHLLHEVEQSRKFPEHPERDVMLFLLEYAPLERWERDVLSLIREEAYYFAPQGQTKILNEGWACVTGNTLINTDSGLIPIQDIVSEFRPVRVFDGQVFQPVIDFAHIPNRKTVKVTTRRGFILEGSDNHRVLLSDGKTWKQLSQLQKGEACLMARGTNLWSESYYHIDWELRKRLTLQDVAHNAGVNISTVIRHMQGTFVSRSAAQLAPQLEQYQAQLVSLPSQQSKRKPIRVPAFVDERFGAFLGYLIGDGHISKVKREVGLTTGDTEQAECFSWLVSEIFGLTARTKQDGNRMRVGVSSENLRDLLEHMGLTTGVSARFKSVPTAVLRSPKSVVAAFLRALFDCDGYAGPQGVILSSSSTKLVQQVQLLFLNFGILSTRSKQNKAIWNLYITGKSAKLFLEEIGFGLKRKQVRLQKYVHERQWFKKEDEADEVVDVEYGQADVYDLTVANSHRYSAHGFINHNSFWHSKIMTEKMLTASEVIDYADHNAGVLSMKPGQFNPYKIGIELLRDIEDRWNKGKFGKEYDECSDMVQKKNWDCRLGLGREKIFEVRKLYNDVNFIDTFLTPEFCQQQKLFVFSYNVSADQYELASREFAKVKQQLLFQLTNFGRPIIHVEDGNYKNRGDLQLKHVHEGVDIKIDYARETMKNLFTLWRRPVHLETILEGLPKVLSYDGENFSELRV